MTQKNSSLRPSEHAQQAAPCDLEDFAYDLPEELIAQEPLAVRHDSRLMVVDRDNGSVAGSRFSSLPDWLRAGDLLVANDTRVIPARLQARRATGASVQLLLLRPEASRPGLWHAMATNMRKLKQGELLTLEPAIGDSAAVRVDDITTGTDGQKRLLVDFGSQERVYTLLKERGLAPLPPYIRRNGDLSRRQSDLDRYQTVFAQAPGAVAAPTAGLHFSQQMLEHLSKRGAEMRFLTLHVGPGTFKPITTSVAEHSIEPERFTIPEETASAVNAALAEGRRVIAVGTTSCRALETAGASGRLQPVSEAETSLYIRPGYRFQVISGLITNFHLSRSSLLVLVAAFAGHELIMRAYRQAVDDRYRFFSYGDAMLIL